MLEIGAPELRTYLVGHLGLNQFQTPERESPVAFLLARGHCLQLDPLSPMGTATDLVAAARLSDYRLDDLFHNARVGDYFEHYAKERCLIEPAAFYHYPAVVSQAPWVRIAERMDRLDTALIDDVLFEIRERGPLRATDLTDRGRVEPLDWSGWKGTAKASVMALEILWSYMRVVISHRLNGERFYDVPERVFKPQTDHQEDGLHWLLNRRMAAAGVLSAAGGPQWSMLDPARTSGMPDQMVESGEWVAFKVKGYPRKYYAPSGFLERSFPESDNEVRILSPLDPLIWDRKLVAQAFDFDYVWEVYKPAKTRRWGWYVCPLLQGHHLVGRVEARVQGQVLVVDKVWNEARIPRSHIRRALTRHARICNCTLQGPAHWLS
ncbi:MAG: YcaQ family DNA glycosylase [Acidobacteria bacterium]|nr:YcaQ family DNA glycosylase [Acidobacteriota bacterium]MCB9396989.1 YcaQ family DNA glycosylase [Acidobacteriota bacterium]